MSVGNVTKPMYVRVYVGTLQPTDRQKDLLTPSVATPPRLSELSTSVETVVEWDQSSLVQPISDTPVHYLLQYRLPPLLELQNVTVS